MSRSPKRTALHEYHQRRSQVLQAAADARRPFDKVKDGEERAAALVGQRESELAALDRAEAELIANNESYSPTEATGEQRQARRNAEENLSAARRALAAVRKHGHTVQASADHAAKEAQRVASEGVVFVDDVLKEEADAALATLAAARAEVVKQEAAVRSIAAALAHRKSYRHAEVASVALNTMPWPEAKPNPAPYLTLAERLTVDADATVLP